MRAWLDGHLGVPLTGRPDHHLRSHQVAARLFPRRDDRGRVQRHRRGDRSADLGVPLAGTIAVVTFITAYVPFVGAFVAGAFAVMIALGAKGTSTALIMLVIVLLANGRCRTSCSLSRWARPSTCTRWQCSVTTPRGA